MTRFRKEQLYELIDLLGMPLELTAENGLRFPSEHGVFLYLYHLSYPTKLQRMQKEFGREYSQLSRIENAVKDFLLPIARPKVVGNTDFYSPRFSSYATAYNRAIAYSIRNPNPGFIPPEITNIIGSLDGSSFPIARLKVPWFI